MTDMNRAEGGPSTVGRGWGVRVAALLAAVALVPLGGTVYVVSGELAEAGDRVDAAVGAGETAARVVRLTELQASVIDEMNWASASTAIQSFGVPLSVVDQMAGIDLEEELSGAAAAVDELVSDLGLGGVAVVLEDVRGLDADVGEVSSRYGELADEIGSMQAAAF